MITADLRKLIKICIGCGAWENDESGSHSVDEYKGGYQVVCWNCAMRGSIGKTYEEAIDNWNSLHDNIKDEYEQQLSDGEQQAIKEYLLGEESLEKIITTDGKHIINYEEEKKHDFYPSLYWDQIGGMAGEFFRNIGYKKYNNKEYVYVEDIYSDFAEWFKKFCLK
jgi:hypothetical protein